MAIIQKSFQVVSQNNLDQQSTAMLSIGSIGVAGKFKRAVKILSVTWGISLLCILVPVLHFVLVPLGLITGLILFYRQFLFSQALHDGDINCPSCGHVFSAEKKAFNWPKRERCPECSTVLIVKN